VLLLALLASVGINAGLTAGIVYAVKDTKVGDGGLLVSSDTGEAIKVASADFSVKPMVAPDDETEEAATEWHRDGSNATTSVLVDANGGAVATAAATDKNSVLVDARGNAVKTQAAVYKASFDSAHIAPFLLGATPDKLESLTKLRVESDGAQVELAITGWSSKSCSVFGVQPTSNADDSYWALDLVNVSQGTRTFELELRVLLFETSHKMLPGVAVSSLLDRDDDESEPWFGFRPVSSANMERLSTLVTSIPNDDEAEAISTTSLNHIMNKVILPGREVLEVVHNHTLGAPLRHARRQLSGRNLLVLNGIYQMVTIVMDAVLDGDTDAIVCPVLQQAIALVDSIVSQLTYGLLQPLVEGTCSSLQDFVLERLEAIGEICLIPESGDGDDGDDEDCAIDLGLGEMQEIPALGVTLDGEQVLTVRAGVTFNACMEVVSTQIDCAELARFVAEKAQEYLEETLIDPIRDFHDDLGCPSRRRLADHSQTSTIVHGIAVAALKDVSGEGHRRLHEAHKDPILHNSLMMDALKRGEQMIQDKLAAAAVARFRNVGRRKLSQKLQSSGESHRVLSEEGSLDFGQLVTKFRLEASVTVRAEATMALEEHREVDLIEHFLGQRARFSQSYQIPVVPMLLGFGFTPAFEMGLPLEVRASFQGAAAIEGRVGYHRSWTITMDANGAGVAEEVLEGDGITLTAEGEVSASLSVSVGAYVSINLRLEAIIAAVVNVFAEAGARWEAKVGGDLAACGYAATEGASGSVSLCAGLRTELTDYIEYKPSEVALASAGGLAGLYAQVGVWVYVPYPAVSFSAGITFPGSDSVAACLGVPLEWKWNSNFGSPDGKRGEAHPNGHYIFRTARAIAIELPAGGGAVEAPLDPPEWGEVQYHIVCGATGRCGTGGLMTDDPTRTSIDGKQIAVRCCDGDSANSFGSNRKFWGGSCGNVYGGSPGCSSGTTLAEAESVCASNGGRLCTKEELTNDCTRSTGCSFDQAYVWSSSRSVESREYSFYTYTLGELGEGSCPFGSVEIATEAECRAAAAHYGASSPYPTFNTVYDKSNFPKGCVWDSNGDDFNLNTVQGQPNPAARLVCNAGGVREYDVYTNLGYSVYSAPVNPSVSDVLSTCGADNSPGTAIASPEECSAAWDQLGVPLNWGYDNYWVPSGCALNGNGVVHFNQASNGLGGSGYRLLCLNKYWGVRYMVSTASSNSCEAEGLRTITDVDKCTEAALELNYDRSGFTASEYNHPNHKLGCSLYIATGDVWLNTGGGNVVDSSCNGDTWPYIAKCICEIPR